MDAEVPLPDVSGWKVTGRYGPLGHVVSGGSSELKHRSESLLVRGGTTEGLYFHVPMEMVTGVAVNKRLLHVDADIADFTAHLRPDGSVDLLPTPR